MKKYKITVPKETEHDIFDIYDYFARHDSIKQADYVLRKLESMIDSQDQNPARGHIPPELGRIGMKEFKELHLKPYRIIYQISGSEVVVLLLC